MQIDKEILLELLNAKAGHECEGFVIHAGPDFHEEGRWGNYERVIFRSTVTGKLYQLIVYSDEQNSYLDEELDMVDVTEVDEVKKTIVDYVKVG